MTGGFTSDTKPGAIWNVVICGIICVGAFVSAAVFSDRGATSVVVAIVAGVLAAGMEVYFVRRLLAHRRRRAARATDRRAVSAGRGRAAPPGRFSTGVVAAVAPDGSLIR